MSTTEKVVPQELLDVCSPEFMVPLGDLKYQDLWQLYMKLDTMSKAVDAEMLDRRASEDSRLKQI